MCTVLYSACLIYTEVNYWGESERAPHKLLLREIAVPMYVRVCMYVCIRIFDT